MLSLRAAGAANQLILALLPFCPSCENQGLVTSLGQGVDPKGPRGGCGDMLGGAPLWS
jgi:hypothetical protein